MRRTLKILGLFLLLVVGAMAALMATSSTPLPVPEGTHPEAYERGMAAYEAGELSEALRWLRRVAPEDPHYARAMRWIGWKIYTHELRRPDLGAAYLDRSLAASPLEGNVWQDWVRGQGARVKAWFE